MNLEKNSLEELCVADADAISHFDSIPDLLYLAYVQKGMGIEEGKEFVKEKLKRSFQKLSPESQKYYRSKFQKVMEVLNWKRGIEFIKERKVIIQVENNKEKEMISRTILEACLLYTSCTKKYNERRKDT